MKMIRKLIAMLMVASINADGMSPLMLRECQY